MDIVIKLSQFLMSLSLLIILHELGHFIPAKLFKTRVEKFYLFFDVKYALLKKKIGETEYGIGWLPLGGYVKISGMIDESMDKEQMALPPQPWEFRSKPAWQRLIIMLGGVTVNFILAFIIYIGMAFAYGDMFVATADLKDGLLIENPVMQKAGFQTGDKILSIDGEQVVKFDNQMNAKIVMAKQVLIERNGDRQTITMPVDFVDQLSKIEKGSLATIRMPFVVGAVSEGSKNTTLQPKDIVLRLNEEPAKYFDQAKIILEKNKSKLIVAGILRNDQEMQVPVQVDADGKLGVQLGALDLESLEKLGYYKVSKQEYGFFESFSVGIQKGADQLVGYGKQLKMIFNPETKAYKQVGGFAAIFNIFSGKKPSDKFLENAQMVGFVLLISLLLFANGNDIYKAIVGK
jgi:regulator of sigma E protease